VISADFQPRSNLCRIWGLSPLNRPAGDKASRGGITKMGNSHMRSLVIEAAWHYAPVPVYSKRLAEKRFGTDEKIIAMADKDLDKLDKV
jgi:transposase